MVYNAVFSPVATALAPYYATLEATFTGPIATISTTPPVSSAAPTIYEGRGVFRMTGLLTIRNAATGAIVLSENLSGSGLARSDVWVFPSGAVDSYMGYFFDTTSVPEPGSAALAAFGAGLIIWRIRSRSRGRQSAAGQR